MIALVLAFDTKRLLSPESVSEGDLEVRCSKVCLYLMGMCCSCIGVGVH